MSSENNNIDTLKKYQLHVGAFFLDNAWLLKVRELPIIAMLKQMRLKMTAWINDRRKEARQLSENLKITVVPPVYEAVKQNLRRGRMMRVSICGLSIPYISDPSARIEELEFSRGVFTLPMSTVANAFLTGLDNLA
ncbi:hypothetical protein P9112_006199 [Eukaryota sp. TZLM1-RC]